MVIKPADDKESHVAGLERLAARPDADAAIRKRIELDIRFQRAGMRGEREAAYEIDFTYGPTSENWVVIHDLRLVHLGRVAQIDHLLMNRLLQCYVLETKSFSEGVAVNDHGEFTQFYGGKPRGIASPLEQNEKHIAVLNSVLSSDLVQVPTRLGVALKPVCRSLVVVSKTARISRPSREFDGLANILKVDQLVTRLDKDWEKGSAAALLKIVSRETLRELAQQLSSLHEPAPLPNPARYGMAAEPAQVTRAITPKPPSALPAAVQAGAGPVAAQSEGSSCEGCSGPVSAAEARFCRLSKSKFGGRVLCRVCQQLQTPSATAPATAAAAPASSPTSLPRPPAAPISLATDAVPNAKYQCATCGIGLEHAVARFCWMSKARFGGALFCREHQVGK